MGDAAAADDSSLVRRLKRGDHTALGPLVDRYGEDVVRYLSSILGNREEAEDAFQDTWVRVLRGASGIDEGRPLKPWLLRIARNRAFDRLRRRRRWSRVLVARRDDAPVGEPVDPRDPVAVLVAHDATARLLAGLTPMQRELVWLRYHAGCSYSEIAAVCGLPLGTVKSRLARALAALGAAWRELAGEENDARA